MVDLKFRSFCCLNKTNSFFVSVLLLIQFVSTTCFSFDMKHFPLPPVLKNTKRFEVEVESRSDDGRRMDLSVRSDRNKEPRIKEVHLVVNRNIVAPQTEGNQARELSEITGKDYYYKLEQIKKLGSSTAENSFLYDDNGVGHGPYPQQRKLTGLILNIESAGDIIQLAEKTTFTPKFKTLPLLQCAVLKKASNSGRYIYYEAPLRNDPRVTSNKKFKAESLCPSFDPNNLKDYDSVGVFSIYKERAVFESFKGPIQLNPALLINFFLQITSSI